MSSSETKDLTPGNGVVIVRRERSAERDPGYRTYEVHQRERVGESTEKIRPIDLMSDEYRRNPYKSMAILRENYPLYRDWLANSYWITRYNDVTSVFVDDANFETRSKLWLYGMADYGRNYSHELAYLTAEARVLEEEIAAIAQRLVSGFMDAAEADLAQDFAGPLALEVLAESYAIPEGIRDEFFQLYWRAQRGVSWHQEIHGSGKRAVLELEALLAPLVDERKGQGSGEDVISGLTVVVPDLTVRDVVATLLEADHETLHGATANLWYLLLTHPEQFAVAKSDTRLMKLAYLETLRHSPPVLCAHRFTRHEVERFGKLLPQGSRVVCSAAAANRDPRIFSDPDEFIVDRVDLCQREPRGQYRADGLATGIAFGLGKPSRYPAVPEDRPRSRYALVRDAVVAASMELTESCPDIRLKANTEPELVSLTVGEMHTCWSLPVSF